MPVQTERFAEKQGSSGDQTVGAGQKSGVTSFSNEVLGKGDIEPVSFSASCNGCSNPALGKQKYHLCCQNR